MMDQVRDDLDVVMNYTNANDHVPKAQQKQQDHQRENQGNLSLTSLQSHTMRDDLLFGNGLYNKVELFLRKGRGLQILQPPNDIKPDESGLQQALHHTLWYICTSKPRNQSYQHQCTEGTSRDPTDNI